MTSSLSIALACFAFAVAVGVATAQNEQECVKLGFVPTHCTAVNCDKLAKAVGEAGTGNATCQPSFRVYACLSLSGSACRPRK